MMRKTVVVDYSLWIQAPVKTVQTQFADVQHHIDNNVHPRLKFELLAQDSNRARYWQEVRLLGTRQRDLIERRIDDDGSMHDVSIQGFNKGATLDYTYKPEVRDGKPGTLMNLRIAIQTPPLLGFLAPLLYKQVWKETDEAAKQDKRDIEGGYEPSSAWRHAMA